MAQELTIQMSLGFTKALAALGKVFSQSYFDVSGTAAIQNVIAVGTTDETLALGDISTIGWVYMRNLDATNYVTVGSDGTLYPIKLKPLEPMLVRWNAAAIHVKANTASCQLEYVLISD